VPTPSSGDEPTDQLFVNKRSADRSSTDELQHLTTGYCQCIPVLVTDRSSVITRRSVDDTRRRYLRDIDISGESVRGNKDKDKDELPYLFILNRSTGPGFIWRHYLHIRRPTRIRVGPPPVLNIHISHRTNSQ